MKGVKTDYSIKLPLTEANVAPSLAKINLTILLAGKSYELNFAPTPNLVTQFTWDGKDVYNREVNSSVPITVKYDYLYDNFYLSFD